MKLTLRIAALFTLMLAAAAIACADGVTLQFTGATANGEYGPYSMTVNGGPTTPMICFSDKNWITGGETWNASVYTLSTITASGGPAFTGMSAATYDELGWLADRLFANAGNPGVAKDYQLAIWSVLGLSSPFAATTGSAQDLQNAVNAVNGGYQATDVLFYIPSGPNLPLVNGTTPQPFISEVPEPSSLVLLVSGMLALMLLVIRRGRV